MPSCCTEIKHSGQSRVSVVPPPIGNIIFALFPVQLRASQEFRLHISFLVDQLSFLTLLCGSSPLSLLVTSLQHFLILGNSIQDTHAFVVVLNAAEIRGGGASTL